MDTEKKYIFENGVMKLNPKFNKAQPTQSTAADPKKALAIVSTPEDVQAASDLQEQKTGKPMALSEATTASIEIIQDEDFLAKFEAPQPINGGELLDGLTSYFAKYEVPIGMVNKLLGLTEYKLNFIIDDSGSMGSSTDAKVKEAHPEMQGKLAGKHQMTRWQEVEDRLHVMIDMLSFIPTEDIVINFLNRHDTITLSHKGKTPAEFAADAHAKISNGFRNGPNGVTPIFKKLTDAFKSTHSNTMHYLFTDGVPSDATIEQVKQLVTNRQNPKMSPLTFMTCTDEDEEAEWMKEVEEVAPFTAELDDFAAERKEVLHDQGATFPFTKGFWLLSQLVAAINPDDLDALDESTPFTKMTMDNLMGRKLTSEEYKLYFDNNPNARQYASLYNEFAREDIVARRILEQHPGQAAKPAGNLMSRFFNPQQQHGGSSQQPPPSYRP